MGILIFAIVLSFLVIIHELGHFLMARKFGMRVEEFGLGYPPKAKTLRTDKQGTEYTLNWLPFGGFVRLYGEDGPDSLEGRKITAEEGAFFTKPLSQRLWVVLAGAIMNFLFGVIAFGVIYTIIGIPTEFTYAQVEVVTPGSPAEEAGLMVGDQVTSIASKGKVVEIGSLEEFVEAISGFKGDFVVLDLNNREEDVEVYVRTDEEIPEGEGAIGVVISSDVELVRYPLWQMPFRGMVFGVQTAIDFGILLVTALFDMVADLVTMGEVPKDVAGPVGIAYQAEKRGIFDGGLLQILNFAAILSINLAIVNILPIPALDGGRAVFLAYEGVTGRRVKAEWEAKINAIGFAMLILLLVLISVRDVRTVVADEEVRAWFKALIE